MAKSPKLARAGAAMLGIFLLCAGSTPADAGWLQALFGGSDAAAKEQPGRRAWNLQEFTSIRLVPLEPGSAPNQHPIEIDADVLRQQLAQIRIDTRQPAQALFATDELAELIAPLSEALASAGPNDDVLLLSSARRSGVFSQQTAITARLFVQGGRLHLIAHDTRYEFMNALLGGRMQPQFTFGSRGQGSAAVIRGAAAEQKRNDWLALATTAVAAPPPATPQAAPAPPMPAQPAAAPVPAQPVPAPPAAAVPVVPAPASPAAVAPLRPRDPGFAEDVEQRLLTLKRLRERNLISEEEYQQKRREILQQL